MRTAPDAEAETDLLAAAAEEFLNEAQKLESTLHLSGVRDDYRIRIERCIDLATLALQGVNDDHQRTRIRKSLVAAHAARAEDARYGAGQLSRSAQRAPTREDCEDGWSKVRSIVENAKTSSLEASRHADGLGDHRSQKLAAQAERAATSAQRTLDQRNQAYTFFTEPGFSFGEGWYLAAASLLVGLPIQEPRCARPLDRSKPLHLPNPSPARESPPDEASCWTPAPHCVSPMSDPEHRGRSLTSGRLPFIDTVMDARAAIRGSEAKAGSWQTSAPHVACISIQVKAGTAQAAQARHFLHDVGLSAALVPYRSRPANPKHLTDIIARSFRDNPCGAQGLLRAGFLGGAARPSALVEWVAQRVGKDSNRKVLVWVRISDHDAHRNTDFEELQQISRLVINAGLTPVFFGDAIDSTVTLEGAIDLTLCWKEPIFQGADMRRAQLQLFEELRQRHGLIGQIGVTTAGMDGPALLGLPTAYLTAAPNVRLGKWVGAVPGYKEIVRQPGYLETLGSVLEHWVTQPVQGGFSSRPEPARLGEE